jgi:hypothetical protein
MHIHSTQTSALGNALAGAQDAETALSLKRARELRDAATRLRAASFEMSSDIPENPETVSMVAAWSGNPTRHPTQLQTESSALFGADAGIAGSAAPSSQMRENQRTPPTSPASSPVSSPVSYWA